MTLAKRAIFLPLSVSVTRARFGVGTSLFRLLPAAPLFLWPLPSAAAECSYLNGAGDRLTFVQDGENTVTIDRNDGPDAVCSWGVNGDTAMPDIECDDGSKTDYFFSPATRNGNGQDLLVFQEQVWYRTCQ